MTMVRRIRFENKGQAYTMRCNYCKRPKKELYQAQFEDGGPTYMLCPGACLKASYINYKEKKEKNIMPPDTTKQDDAFSETMRESMDDNIERNNE